MIRISPKSVLTAVSKTFQIFINISEESPVLFLKNTEEDFYRHVPDPGFPLTIAEGAFLPLALKKGVRKLYEPLKKLMLLKLSLAFGWYKRRIINDSKGIIIQSRIIIKVDFISIISICSQMLINLIYIVLIVSLQISN